MEAETVEAVSNPINWGLILAFVGAAAWIPIAVGAARKWITKPKLDIVIGQQAEIGYTTNSTICNLELAARVHNKPALVTRIAIKLEHEQGRNINLNWTGLSETPLRAQSTTGDEAEYTRTLNAVAVQVLPNTDVIQRKVLFSDTAEGQQTTTLGGSLGRRVQLMHPNDPTEDDVKGWDEYSAFVDHLTNGFCWEVGRYDGKVIVHTQELKEPVEKTFSFSINANGLAHLRANVPAAKEKLLGMALFDEERSKDRWAWLYPLVES